MLSTRFFVFVEYCDFLKIKPMVDQLKKRVEELKDEYTAGEKMLQKMEADAADLKSTMLRLKGAITVLEEILENEATGKP